MTRPTLDTAWSNPISKCITYSTAIYIVTVFIACVTCRPVSLWSLSIYYYIYIYEELYVECWLMIERKRLAAATLCQCVYEYVDIDSVAPMCSVVHVICTRFCCAGICCGQIIFFADLCVLEMSPGGRLNNKDGLTRYGDSHVKDKTS